MQRSVPRTWRHRFVEAVSRLAGWSKQERESHLVWVSAQNHLSLFKEPHLRNLAAEVHRRCRAWVRLGSRAAVGG